MEVKNACDGYQCRVSLRFSDDQAVVRHLDLHKFKTMSCPRGQCHPSRCPYFHSSADYRRNPFVVPYESGSCPSPGECGDGSQCLLSHNRFETEYHPSTYKVTLCKSYKKGVECLAGELCARAHSPADLRVPLLHTMTVDFDFLMFKFKTEHCPFAEPHDQHHCVYSHGLSDYRRAITSHPYSKELCPTGEQGADRVCPNRSWCRGCHNFYEWSFHPLNFKRHPCDDTACQYVFCPFIHKGEQPLMHDFDQLDGFFLYPFNRSANVSNSEEFHRF